jgi:hypothetical protein
VYCAKLGSDGSTEVRGRAQRQSPEAEPRGRDPFQAGRAMYSRRRTKTAVEQNSQIRQAAIRMKDLVHSR